MNLLSPKEHSFVENYLRNGGNATQAAIEAGYAPKGVSASASRVLKRARVREVLDRRRQEIREAGGEVTPEAILGRLWLEAQGKACDDTTSASRVAALHHLAKITGMVKDQREITAVIKHGRLDEELRDLSGIELEAMLLDASPELLRLNGNGANGNGHASP